MKEETMQDLIGGGWRCYILYILEKWAAQKPIGGEDDENSITECDCGICAFLLW